MSGAHGGRRRPLIACAAVGLVACAVGSDLHGARAAGPPTFIVNTTVDGVDATPGDGVCATAGGFCTLRAAIMEGNSVPTGATVTLPAGIYTLTIPPAGTDDAGSGDLNVTGRLVIAGAGSAATIVDGGLLDRVFNVAVGATAQISGVTIRNGRAQTYGGGIAAAGTLVLNDSTVTGNATTSVGGGVAAQGGSLERVTITANSALRGGGVAQALGSGQLKVDSSTISANTATTTGGGAIEDGGGTLSITASTLSNNCASFHTTVSNGLASCPSPLPPVSGPVGSEAGGGGGVEDGAGTFSIDGSTVSGNVTDWIGGGLEENGGGDLIVTHTVVTGNQAGEAGGGIGLDGGGIFTMSDTRVQSNIANPNRDAQRNGGGGGIAQTGDDTYTIATSFISGNTAAGNGGGVSLESASTGGRGGSGTITRTTISGNHTDAIGPTTRALGHGGGLLAGGDNVSLTNVTFSGNAAKNGGGGIATTAGQVNVLFSTLADNSSTSGGGNIDNQSTQAAVTVKDTLLARGAPNCAGTSLTSGGWNIQDGEECFTLLGTADQFNTDPGLAPLADNGGPAPTYGLVGGSPAVDAGSPDCPPPATDERGSPRPQGSGCDSGAFEGVVGQVGGAQSIVLQQQGATWSSDGTSLTIGVDVSNSGTVATDVTVQIVPGTGLSLGEGVADTQAIGVLDTNQHAIASWTLGAPSGCDDATFTVDFLADYAERHPPGNATPPPQPTLHEQVTRTGCTALSGNVTYSDATGPLAGAEIDICPTSAAICTVVTADDKGHYSATGLQPGDYDVTARPGLTPPANDLVPVDVSVHVDQGSAVVQDFDLKTVAVSNLTINGQSFHGDQVPSTFWGKPFTVTALGCPGGSATLSVDGTTNYFKGPMAEGPRGTYSVTVPALRPHFGWAKTTVTFKCPDGSTRNQIGDLHVDPSGTVQDPDGNPIAGASVTILRAATPGGPFNPVPDGSPILSIANTHNPSSTDADGHFGWDVLAGFYKVHAAKPGCTTADSTVLTIPPPVTDLVLVLTCPIKTVATYTGPTSGDFHDAVVLSARLTDDGTPAHPVAGKSLTIGVGSQSCATPPTSADGEASCTLLLGQAPGVLTATAAFAGDDRDLAATSALAFTLSREEITLDYSGPTTLAIGTQPTLSGLLREDGVTPVAGRSVTFTVGAGPGSQACTGQTGADGVATCVLGVPLNQPLGPSGIVSATFPGDADYVSVSTSASTLVFAYLASGTFVVGDGSASAGSAVTFWSARWSSANVVSGGVAPASFKGFAATSASPPTCGSFFASLSGNSSDPPSAIPTYMAVVATSSVSRLGRMILGNVVHIYVVRTDAGYAGNPGHSGSGTIVGTVC